MSAFPELVAGLLLAHVAATLAMTGLVWFVQLVHYPLYAGVGSAGFAAYERDHTRRTSWIVAPAMLIELATAVPLVALEPQGVPAWAAWSGLALLAVVWLSTLLLQMPRHARLCQGFDAAAATRREDAAVFERVRRRLREGRYVAPGTLG